MPDTSALKGSDTVVLPPNPEIDARIDTLKRRLDDLSMQYTDQHPDIVATKRIIADLEKRKMEESKVSKSYQRPRSQLQPPDAAIEC